MQLMDLVKFGQDLEDQEVVCCFLSLDCAKYDQLRWNAGSTNFMYWSVCYKNLYQGDSSNDIWFWCYWVCTDMMIQKAFE